MGLNTQTSAWDAMPSYQRAALVNSGRFDATGRDLSQANAAQQVQGGPGVTGGGAGSSYTTQPSGATTTTVTPNLLPQEDEITRGQMTLKSELEQKARADQARLAAEAETRRIANMSSFASSTPAAPHVGGGTGPAVDEGAARAAAFGHAKEMAGQNALASLKALQDVVDSRGLTGSTVEAAGRGEIINGAHGGVQDFIDEQLQSDLGRASQVADRNYTGEIAQRGQDLQARQALLGLLGSSGGLY